MLAVDSMRAVSRQPVLFDHRSCMVKALRPKLQASVAITSFVRILRSQAICQAGSQRQHELMKLMEYLTIMQKSLETMVSICLHKENLMLLSLVMVEQLQQLMSAMIRAASPAQQAPLLNVFKIR